MKIQWKKLIICIAIPLVVGGLSSLLTMNAMEHFATVEQPPFAPPGWLFPIAWSILYVLMGIASYLVLVSDKPARAETALTVYGIQLGFNFFWSILFFNFEIYLFSFFWLIALWVLIILTTVLFWRISKPSGWLMVPYLAWVTFAAYLNLGVYLLN